jgi:hypothetical protein
MKAFDGQSQTIGGKITFSEPLTSKLNLVLDYAHNRNSSSSYRNTYNKGTNGKYEVLDSVFSNNFDFDAYSNSSTTILRFIDKKVRFSFGSGVSAVNFNLLDQLRLPAFYPAGTVWVYLQTANEHYPQLSGVRPDSQTSISYNRCETIRILYMSIRAIRT